MTDLPKEVIAYQGSCFIIEWFYDKSGYSEAFDYYQCLPADRRRKLLILLKRIGDTGRIFDKTKFRHEGDQIYAFKPQPDRYLCFFFTGKKIIITNAFEKKADRLPKKEKHKALIYKEDYEQRIHEGIYSNENL
jgi:phage-related protein